MSHFGIDIGSYSIKFVKAEGHDTKATIKTIGSVYNPTGQILPSDVGQFEQLAATIKNSIREFGLSGLNCHLGLPAQQAYMSIISMPVLTDAELSSAIRWEAEQHIPVNLSEVNFEYDVVWRPDSNSSEEAMTVFIVGAPKTIVEKYIKLMDLAGVELIGLEPEILSLLRGFLPNKEENTGATLVCNFGALSSNFAVLDAQRLYVVHSAAIGSLALTRALERGLGLDPSRSEEYKRSYGLEASQLEGKVRNVLLPVFDTFVKEARKTMQFYVTKSPAHNLISRVIVTGGGANLPAMVPYLAEVLSVEVVVGNPFTQFHIDKKIVLPADLASYGVAAGLATKAF